MDENRVGQYLELIQALLNCPSGEEGQILQANSELVDEGLVEVMERVAEQMAADGNQNADWLRNYAAEIVRILGMATSTKSQEYLQFLMQVLCAIVDSDGNPEVVYPLLQDHLDKLDEEFTAILQSWATYKLSEAEPQQVDSIAYVLVLFGNLIQQFPLGNKTSNMETALKCYQKALPVLTPEAFPQDWSMTQNNLGLIYSHRVEGDKAENVESAIECYQKALQVYSPETSPQDWATTQNNLATAYRNRIRGNKAENLERAIEYYQKVLKFCPPEIISVKWAMTQNNLGLAYRDRIRRDKTHNLERAIESYQNALQVYTRKAFPQDWAATQNNLAIAYSERIRGDKAHNLEKAIEFCQNALQVYTREAFPQNWAGIQNNLANAYGGRIQEDKAHNLEKAIEFCQNALQVYTREAFPQNWAQTQNNLANAYQNRIQGDKAYNLEKAIESYLNALQVYTLEASPQDWATIQNNLANAYQNRIRGDKAHNLEKVLEFCQSALLVRTLETLPQDWAQTQNNLAIAYSNRIQGDKAHNLEKAIESYLNALQVYTLEASPQDWATIQNNLANAYQNRIREDKAHNLEKAIESYQNALLVRTLETLPQDWAQTQNNLAIAYSNRIQGDKAHNLEKAIESYLNALQVYTLEASPQDWATIQNNLAAVYSNRTRGDRSQNLGMAIESYQNALQVRSREAFPQDYAKTLFNLGVAYREAQQWQLAYDTLSSAIDTVESLREKIISGDQSKQKLAEEWNQLYLVIVETCLQLNKLTKALEYAERSKTRNLVEQILLRDSDTLFPPEVATQLTQLRKNINSAQKQIQQGKAENYAELAQRLQNWRQQRNQLQDTYLPIGPSFQFDSFRTTLDRGTAIIEWYITGGTFLAFIITQDAAPVVWQSPPNDLDKLIDWANAYLQTYAKQKDLWRNQLADALQNLAQILHLDELLTHLPSSCKRLILIPHRVLHLFPLHALPIKNEKFKIQNLPPATESRYLLDIFPKGVSYAPSCQLLQQVKTRQRPNFDTLFAIQTPTSDLYDSDLGTIEVIQKQFANSDILSKEKATKSTLLPVNKATQTLIPYEKLQTVHSLLFFCHGEFKLNSPLDSGLQLADDNLSLAEIILHFRLDNCRLVTLSACETGLVDFNNSSDEYIGLPNGFLIAGSRAVLSSLWKVQSLSTALLVVRVYQNLKSGISLAVALQQAQSWLRNATKTDLEAWGKKTLPNANHRRQLKIFLRQQETEKPFASPYHWAAFCAIGE